MLILLILTLIPYTVRMRYKKYMTIFKTKNVKITCVQVYTRKILINVKTCSIKLYSEPSPADISY